MTKSFLSKVNVVSIPQLSLEELTSGELASDDWSEHEKISNPMNSSSDKYLRISESNKYHIYKQKTPRMWGLMKSII